MDIGIKFPLKNPEVYNSLLFQEGAKLIQAYMHYDEIFMREGVDIKKQNFRLRVKKPQDCTVIFSYSTTCCFRDIPLKLGVKSKRVRGSYDECLEYLNRTAKYQFTIRKLVGRSYELPPFTINIEDIRIEKEGFILNLGNFSEIEAEGGEFIDNIERVGSLLKKAGIRREEIISVPFCAYVKQEFRL